jgi:putative flippase GtrA
VCQNAATVFALESFMSAALQSLVRDVPPKSSASAMLPGLLTFIAVGGTGTATFVVLSSLVIGLQTGLPDWTVNALCYAGLILPVYLLHRRFSFRSDTAHRRALPRYVAVQASGLLLATLFSFLVHGYLTLPTVFASTLVMVLTVGINFVVLRSWAFARTQLTAPAAT